jgi:hypothetical protein
MALWKVFRDGEMIVPSVGRKVHYIEEEDGTCWAADLLGFNSGDSDDSSTLNANLLTYDPDEGTDVFASGIDLSGVDGPTFPNWHYSNHNPNLVP